MKKYFYGLAQIDGNDCTRFICKDIETIPHDSILTEEIECKSSEINKIAEKLLSDYYLGKLDIKPEIQQIKPKNEIINGSVVYYIDDRHHTALCLEIGKIQSKILLVTSNPFWNPYSRKLTEEENMLLGFPDRGKVSYFAPCIRLSVNLSTPKAQFPSHRIKDLLNEFKTFNPKY